MENRVTETKVEVPNNNIEKNESEKGLSTNEKDVKMKTTRKAIYSKNSSS